MLLSNPLLYHCITCARVTRLCMRVTRALCPLLYYFYTSKDLYDTSDTAAEKRMPRLTFSRIT